MGSKVAWGAAFVHATYGHVYLDSTAMPCLLTGVEPPAHVAERAHLGNLSLGKSSTHFICVNSLAAGITLSFSITVPAF